MVELTDLNACFQYFVHGALSGKVDDRAGLVGRDLKCTGRFLSDTVSRRCFCLFPGILSDLEGIRFRCGCSVCIRGQDEHGFAFRIGLPVRCDLIFALICDGDFRAFQCRCSLGPVLSEVRVGLDEADACAEYLVTDLQLLCFRRCEPYGMDRIVRGITLCGFCFFNIIGPVVEAQYVALSIGSDSQDAGRAGAFRVLIDRVFGTFHGHGPSVLRYLEDRDGTGFRAVGRADCCRLSGFDCQGVDFVVQPEILRG